ncbi:hypothetical protein QYE76_068949 [Lolium multiflorum]|uniref:Uncharacterized protein n=1 Tax=Lolium multiflorum TaxID=4521 RepID=A0AAD8SGA7_LOLMU|nr:hypothetical protein QYE76_068949 [Lolium multiflorum]
MARPRPQSPRAQPRTPARRAGLRPGGLYIDEPAAVLAQVPQAQPEEDDDPELQAALAASRELNDLEELAKWLHLAEALRASVLEEMARKAQEDAEADAWAFLAMARRQEEATRQATLQEEESAARSGTSSVGRSGEEAAWHACAGRRALRTRIRRERAHGRPGQSPAPSSMSSWNSASPPAASSSSTTTTTSTTGRSELYHVLLVLSNSL